jgi:hypothetical protein
MEVHTSRGNWLRVAVAAAELMHVITTVTICAQDVDGGRYT